MKKIIALIVLTLLSLSLIGCTKENTHTITITRTSNQVDQFSYIAEGVEISFYVIGKLGQQTEAAESIELILFTTDIVSVDREVSRYTAKYNGQEYDRYKYTFTFELTDSEYKELLQYDTVNMKIEGE